MPSAATASAEGIALLLQPWEPKVVAAFLNPEILIGTGFYLVLKPLLKAWAGEHAEGGVQAGDDLYNIVMAVFSAACFVATTTALGWDRGYGAGPARLLWGLAGGAVHGRVPAAGV